MHPFEQRRPPDRLQDGEGWDISHDFLIARQPVLAPATGTTSAWRGRSLVLLLWFAACVLAMLVYVEPLRASSSTPDPAEVAERNRLLEYEIRLAARPQTYLLLDLQAAQLLIKARCLELHRLAISSWTTQEQDRLTDIFYLTTRPAIPRSKAGAQEDPSANPIVLSDMPTMFELPFDPPLVVLVGASTHRSVWVQLRSQVVRWWHSLRRLSHSLSDTSGAKEDLHPPTISLSLAEEDAQSLAWTVTDGMPLLILRKSLP
jgi:hypothetical protein